ncbi:tyrosine-type recombinase/integrase [Halomonas alkaliantarctica]|uniref:Tyrosine-type recombinase/integrase n=1 Tax=Halomonas alkaliantarctica TaxID=232346 RepID=A0ABY8LQB7_9GAMM|nr:tyrosine-type recombinase/integrase [Halomonas alkaliantarctica]WGI26600.1 tyrosine-type recombinase/integrase [Halomonas alkaliantarctica]
MSHLERRANRWYAVLTIPKEVRPKLGGKIRFVKSTGTTDKRVAQSRAYALVAEWKDQIAKAQGNDEPGGSFFDGVLEYRQQLEELRRSNDLQHYEALAGSITSKAEKLDSQGNHEDAQRLASVALGEQTPITPELVEWRSNIHLKQKTVEQMEKDAKRMANYFEVIEAINTESVRKWAKALMAPKEQDGHGYGVSSVRRCFTTARNVWHHLQETGKAPTDREPFKLPSFVLRQERASSASKAREGTKGWIPFDPIDVVSLHRAAMDGGDHSLADLIDLGMFTGARIEELCSLRTDDSSTDRLRVTDSKTDAGIREIPVHHELKPTIKRLLAESKDGYLLSGLTFNKYGDRSNAIGKRFGRLKARHGFGSTFVFHSIRKTVVTLLEDAGVSENLTADIVGHEKPRVTYGLYSGGHSLKSKREAIELINYPT